MPLSNFSWKDEYDSGYEDYCNGMQYDPPVENERSLAYHLGWDQARNRYEGADNPNTTINENGVWT